MTSEAADVLVIIPDLFFLSRVRSVAASRSIRLEAARLASELVTRATANPPHLIVLDMGGDPAWSEAVRALKADPRTASVPIIVFGPHVDEASQALGRAAGADRVLSNRRFTEALPRLFEQYLGRHGADQPGSA